MRDAFEERLADQLGALGTTVDDEPPPPVDLEQQVLRRRRQARATRRWSGLGIAAAIVAALTTVALMHGTAGRSGTLRIATSSTTAAPVHDSLQPGTVMLSARGRFVVSLDAAGNRNATMVTVAHGNITYARATDDHRALWYLSLKKGADSCGDVVRADIEGRSSTIVAHATAFDVSPDGSRLALYGAGDLANDQCSPVKAGALGRIVVLDLENGTTSALNAVGSVTSMRWSPDGSSLVVMSCPSGCSGLLRIDVPVELVPELTFAVSGDARDTFPNPVRAERFEFGRDGLYSLIRTGENPSATATTETVGRYLPDGNYGFGRRKTILSGGTGWDVSQVVPTGAGMFVVAAPVKAGATSGRATDAGLYRIAAGKLVRVRPLPDPGTLTPVTPLR